MLSFRRYLVSRQWDFGRTNQATWNFIAEAKGDERILAVDSWAQLNSTFRTSGASEEKVARALAVWKSYRRRQRTCSEH